MMTLTQQKLELIGIYGVLRETIKLISTATTIFTQITLAFLLPLSLLIFTLFKTPNLWSFHSLPFISVLLLLLFFFLSTAAAVFAAASTLAGRQLSFHQLLRVSPKVCKQHLITFLCLIIDFLAFNFIALSAITLICIAILSLLYFESFEFLTRFLILFFSAEAFYFALIWEISTAVSVFEADSYGFEAIARSKELIEGKATTTAALILLILISLPFGVILFVFRYVVAVESALVEVGILGIVWIWWFLMFSLNGSVLYLVCKSCHGESIHKSELSAHLQGCYFPVHSEAAEVEDDDDNGKSIPCTLKLDLNV